MRKPVLAVAACAVTAFVGCSKSATTGPGNSQNCTVTLSGAVTGSYTCQSTGTGWNANANSGGFSFFIAQAGTTPGIAASIGWTGEPTAGVPYTESSAGASGGVSVTTGSGVSAQLWAALVANASGSYTLGYTSVRNAVTAGNGKAYTADGTFDATLQPVGAQTDTVTLHVTF